MDPNTGVAVVNKNIHYCIQNSAGPGRWMTSTTESHRLEINREANEIDKAVSTGLKLGEQRRSLTAPPYEAMLKQY